MNKTILKVIVGSQAHGLAGPDSDFDYRGVFVMPTSEILSLGSKVTSTSWIEDKDDDTSWEIGHFLNMAVHCNPTILETFLAPIVRLPNNYQEIGDELRGLFPHLWNSKGVMEAFVGYGLNQRKKFFDDKDSRASKYAVAYLRTLYQGWELLTTGTFTVRVADTEIGPILKNWKAMNSIEIHKIAGEVIELCLAWEKKVREVCEKNPDKQTDVRPVNDFLLKVRREFWE